MENYDLIVSREDFYQALKLLELNAKGKDPPLLIAHVENKALQLKIGGISTNVPCDGWFFGTAYIPGGYVKKIKRLLPDKETIKIKAFPNHIRIEEIKYSCEWVGIKKHTELIVPINMTLADFIVLKNKYSKEEIKIAGLLPKYEAALKQIEKKIYRVADELKGFGISPTQIKDFIENTIMEKFR